VLSIDTVLMVSLSAFVTAIGGERLPSDVFSLDKTICFRSVEFIANRFGGLSLTPSEMVRAPLSQTPPVVSHRSCNRP
jgi:hypothetical protein